MQISMNIKGNYQRILLKIVFAIGGESIIKMTRFFDYPWVIRMWTCSSAASGDSMQAILQERHSSLRCSAPITKSFTNSWKKTLKARRSSAIRQKGYIYYPPVSEYGFTGSEMTVRHHVESVKRSLSLKTWIPGHT